MASSGADRSGGEEVVELGEDAAGGVEVAPPHVDDLPSERSERARRRASRCWASGVACHRHDWHSIPILRRGSARSSSAIRIPRSSRTGYSSTSRIPVRSRTFFASRWNQLRGSRRPSRSSSSINSVGGPARPRLFHRIATSRSSSRLMTEAQRAIDGPSCRSEPGRRSQQRQCGGHRQDADRVDLGHIGCVGEPRA